MCCILFGVKLPPNYREYIMLLSMTGFGESQKSQDGIRVHVEIKTVNNRFFKLSLHISEGYSLLESQIDSLLRQSIKRGTVQLNVNVVKEFSSDSISFNAAAMDAYWAELSAWAKKAGVSAIQPESLLTLPGVIENANSNKESSLEDDWKIIVSAISEAAEKLSAMRLREGEAMKRDLSANISEIRSYLEEIRTLAPNVPKNYASKLTERLNAILSEQGVEIDPKDIVREVAIFTDKCDISEEIVRLSCHLDQFDSLLESNNAEGRKLDFLTQEMNRETNTIGSKANDLEIARRVIDIKAIIEKIREMVQNVE